MEIDKSKMTPAERALLEEFEKRYGMEEPSGAVEEAEAKAAELMKANPELTRAQAIDKILQVDPALAERYEREG